MLVCGDTIVTSPETCDDGPRSFKVQAACDFVAWCGP